MQHEESSEPEELTAGEKLLEKMDWVKWDIPYAEFWKNNELEGPSPKEGTP